MNTPDISMCKSPHEVRETLQAALAAKTVVGGPADARRWFRRNGIKGKVKVRNILNEKKEYRGILGRNILTYIRIDEYFVDPKDGKCIYSYDVITY